MTLRPLIVRWLFRSSIFARLFHTSNHLFTFLILLLLLLLVVIPLQILILQAVSNNLDARSAFSGPCLSKNSEDRPECPDSRIGFYLFSRAPDSNITCNRVEVSIWDSNLVNLEGFNPSRPTKIIIHGYNSDMNLSSLIQLREEYLSENSTIEVNVISMDWSILASGPCYPQAVAHVPHVGNCLAHFVQLLRSEGSEDIHIIGFSLGAHVPAFAANHLRILGYVLPRITGLDPAMPLFITVDKDKKLDKSDADFVDVFHTNGLVQGKVERSGHIDIYMNGGLDQPGCWSLGCNHERAVWYFAESVNSEIGFWGWHCEGPMDYVLGLCPSGSPFVLVGEHADRGSSGSFVVRTMSDSPFAMEQIQVREEDFEEVGSIASDGMSWLVMESDTFLKFVLLLILKRLTLPEGIT
ncbi:hypothetical protein QAD02_006111 [Eretmocerus hayati]|uniref:Uncharacterized protein n=1 Tax=Eretmocerus hayati TaxID=131215 RepID=A0ACC2N033_9HYME|nr:hypothetical protein QAD02_006111 [Eretmocerus hayati]